MTPFTAQRAFFTPRKAHNSDERLKMHLSPEDAAKIGRGRPWSAEVTDLDTKRRYSVKGAACGADATCFCDAVVTYEHPLPDRCHVESAKAGAAIRLIIMEEDLEYDGWTVKDIIEWDRGDTPVLSIARSMTKHAKERCGDDFTIEMPDDLKINPLITSAHVKFRKLIEHRIGYKPFTI